MYGIAPSKLGVVGPFPAVPVLVPDVDLLVVAVQQGLLRRGGQPAPPGVDGEAHRVAQRLDQPDEVVADRSTAPRRDRALGQRLVRVGHDQLGVDLHLGAQAGARRAGAPRRVERERPGLELLERQVVVQAGEVLGEHPLPVRVVVGQVDEVEHDHAAGQAERGLHRVGQPAPGGGLHVQPVDHDLDRVPLVLLQRGQAAGVAAVQPDDGPVDPRPRVSLGLELTQQLTVFPLAAADDRGEYLEPGALGQLEDPVDDLLRALPGDRPAADGAVRLAHPGVQQPQVVIHLGDRADGRPRVAPGGLLVDRHRRGQPVDEVDVGLVHLAEELPGVRGQRLHVPALALGEDRVEGQAGLARTGQPGEHDEGVPGQVERDVLEIVLAGTANDQAFSHWRSVPSGRSGRVGQAGRRLLAVISSSHCGPASDHRCRSRVRA